MKTFNEQKVWVISDTHFNHANIIKYCNRPFEDVPMMNNILICNWNSLVAPDDIVIHLGDLALGSAYDLDQLVQSLNGHKILIMGNHDHSSATRYKTAGFEEVYNHFKIYDEKHNVTILFTHTPDSGAYIEHDLHLYGHVHDDDHHGSFPTIAHNGACVCVERWDYKPVLLNEVVEKCLKSTTIAPAVV